MIKKTVLIIFACLALVSCSDKSQDSEKKSLNVKADKDLAQHSDEFVKKVYKIGENVYSAVGFGLANSIMIEGHDGLIIVDTMESVEQAGPVFAEFRKISDKPVKAIIYTHNHVDHIMGASVMTGGGDLPDIYAHDTLNSHVQRLVNKMRPIVGTRSMRMFGTYLDKNDLENAGIGPFLGINDKASSGYLKPTHTFSNELEVIISGIRFKLIHAPGESDDQIYVYLPDQNILICGDNFYKSFPNLYTIRGTKFRSLENWYKSLDIIRQLRPETLIPCHSRPHSGASKIYEMITDYRDAIQFVHDQGIRGINQGMTPDELVEYVKLPPHLSKSPYLQEFYGSVAWSLRSLFSGNLGWFSGDSADLNPLSKKKAATLMADLAGGEKELYSHAMNHFEKQNFQEALLMTGHLLQLDPQNSEIKNLRVESLKALAKQARNANARHYYLTEAAEIRDDFLAKEEINISQEQFSQFPLEGFFSMLATSLDPEASMDIEKAVGLSFPDVDKTFSIYLRKGVAEIRSGLPEDPDILVQAQSGPFKAMLAGVKSPVTTLAGFSYEKGNALSMGIFLKLFDPPLQKLPYEPIWK